MFKSDSVGDEVSDYLQYAKDTNLLNLQRRYNYHLQKKL